MILITTGIKKTFPKKKDKHLLFLSEAAKKYSMKEFYKKYKFKTLEYHWNDRQKLYKDTVSLDQIYEKYLLILSKKLNNLHLVSYSINYWRIFIGPWLFFFIEMIYDRYQSINMASKYKIDYTLCLNILEEDMVPNNMENFSKKYATDTWNHFIYSQILTFYNIPIKYIKTKRISNKEPLKKTKKVLLNKNNTIHFFSSYIKAPELQSIISKLDEEPLYFEDISTYNTFLYSKECRKKIALSSSDDFFTTLLDFLIPKQIPKCYIEGYKLFKDNLMKQYPKKANIIFTGNSYEADDAFKLWTAEHKEKGAKYIINQHGGTFGMTLFASHEKHQHKTADRFFSWGWNDTALPNIRQVFPSRLVNKIKYNPNGDILVPLSSYHRYSDHLISTPLASQALNIIYDQIKYIRLASYELKNLLKLRLYQHDYEWDFKSRITDLGYKQTIDSLENHEKLFHERLSECRLCIGTYNSTTYLETFSQNFPTLLYWNPNHWELKDNAKYYFKILKDAGILHYDAKSLIIKLESIYIDPLSWWMSEDIQKAKNIFCENFVNTNCDIVTSFTNEINKLKVHNGKCSTTKY